MWSFSTAFNSVEMSDLADVSLSRRLNNLLRILIQPTSPLMQLSETSFLHDDALG